ncbi:hypothetical protein [Isoptericola haloaureus]|uniref:Uncharacterized protein n=1 Tax=Isoptericola haloaureus TaxID=1542902 RepID=A0ABU7Z5H1_9MICO
MTSQGYVPQRRERSDRLGGSAATLFGRLDDGDSGATGEVQQHGRAWLERVEHRTRSTGLAWWLRRYGGAYRRMAALNDTEVAQALGIAWLAYACAAVIAAIVVGPWSVIVIVIVPSGIVGLVATAVALVWWFGYRRSGAQLRHQMLARDGLAVLTQQVVDMARDLRVEWELSRNPARTNGGLSCPTLTPV